MSRLQCMAILVEASRRVLRAENAPVSTVSRRPITPALCVGLACLIVVPVLEELPSDPSVKRDQAGAMVDSLRAELAIEQEVDVELVLYHPFVFSVEPVGSDLKTFRLSMEIGFAFLLSDQELRAALSHELGHVWIFTHHPFLQTERLANDIGLRAVSREAMASVYQKLWRYEGTPGVEIDSLLGPVRREDQGR